MPKKHKKKVDPEISTSKGDISAHGTDSDEDTDAILSKLLLVQEELNKEDCEPQISTIKNNKTEVPHPASGRCQSYSCRDRYTCRSVPPSIRTIYSKFPKNYFRLGVLNFFALLLAYFLIYPWINFFWTYYFCENPDIVAMFYDITEKASKKTALLSHLRQLKWLTFPPLAPEILALLLALVIKDCALLYWGESKLPEQSSFCSIMDDRCANPDWSSWGRFGSLS